MFETLEFPIFKWENCDSGNLSGSVWKIVKHSTWVQALMSDADNYELFFPLDATPNQKLTLVGAALMIDYQFFEENPNQR